MSKLLKRLVKKASEQAKVSLRETSAEIIERVDSSASLMTFETETVASTIAAAGVTDVVSGETNGWGKIKLAWQIESIVVRYTILDLNAGIRSMADELGNFFSLAWLFGYERTVLNYIHPILQAFEDGLGRNWRHDRFGGFMLRLFARRMGVEKKVDSILSEIKKGPYEQVFKCWDDDRKLSKVMKDLCDYHLAGAIDERSSTEPFQHCEFLNFPYAVLPAEILCIDKIRQDFGYNPLEVRHPLITSNPLAQIPSTIPSLSNKLLNSLEEELKYNYENDFPNRPKKGHIKLPKNGKIESMFDLQLADWEEDEQYDEFVWPENWPEQSMLSVGLKILGCKKEDAKIDGLIDGEPAPDWITAFVDQLEQSHPNSLVVFDWKEQDPFHIVQTLAEIAQDHRIRLNVLDDENQIAATWKRQQYVWKSRAKKHNAFVAGINGLIESSARFYQVSQLDGQRNDAFGYLLLNQSKRERLEKKMGPLLWEVIDPIESNSNFKQIK